VVSVAHNVAEAPPSPPDEGEALGGRWVWPPLILAVTGLLIWWLGHTTRLEMADAGHPEAAKPAAAAVLPLWPDLGAYFKKALPTHVELSIPERGMEAKLLAFVEDASKPVDKTTWFDFDRLLFDTGSATLRPESQEQLKNVAEILKAYPAVEVKIGGYTDDVGDPASNQKLSEERAGNVRKELAGMGIGEGRLASEGFGEQFPVGDNSTEEGRAQNRRISLRVTRK
jgi:outer membrane protein OmpA-like peptidoglycan-associated protein